MQLSEIHEQLAFQVLLPTLFGLPVFGVHYEQLQVDNRNEGDDVEVDEGPSYSSDFLDIGEGPSGHHQSELNAVEEQIEEEDV